MVWQHGKQNVVLIDKQTHLTSVFDYNKTIRISWEKKSEVRIMKQEVSVVKSKFEVAVKHSFRFR